MSKKLLDIFKLSKLAIVAKFNNGNINILDDINPENFTNSLASVISGAGA